MKRILALLFLVAGISQSGKAQSLKVSAGPNICRFYGNADTLRLGGSPVVQGSTGPFTYTWSTFGGPTLQLLDSANIARPKLTGFPSSQTTDSVDFEIFVTGPNGTAGRDTVRVYYTNLLCTAQSCSQIKQAGDTVQVGNYCATPNIPIRYRWSPVDFISDTTVAQPRVWTPISRVYSSIGTDRLGCSWRRDCVITVTPPNGINPSTATEEQFNVVPNPLTAGSVLQVPAAWVGARYTVTGDDGRVTQKGTVETQSHSFKGIKGNLPAGIYNIRLETASGRVKTLRFQVAE